MKRASDAQPNKPNEPNRRDKMVAVPYFLEYEKLSHISARTASRELEELCKKGVIEKKGKGPAVYYLLARFGEIWRGKGRKKRNSTS